MADKAGIFLCSALKFRGFKLGSGPFTRLHSAKLAQGRRKGYRGTAGVTLVRKFSSFRSLECKWRFSKVATKIPLSASQLQHRRYPAKLEVHWRTK